MRIDLIAGSLLLVTAACATATAPKGAIGAAPLGTVSAEPVGTVSAQPTSTASAQPIVSAEPTSAVSAEPQGVGRYGPGEGESLLTFGGALTFTDPDVGDDVDTLTAQVGYGYFLDEHHEVGGQILNSLSDSDDFESTIFVVAPYYNYNWRQSSRTWYYAGPHIGILYNSIDTPGFDEDDTSFAYGAHGGVRQWITPSTSWFVEPRITKSSDVDDITILFGLNVSFWND
jgi:hypothetical protein